MMNPTSVDWPALDRIHSIVFDFDGVFTDNKVLVDQDGREAVVCSRGDGLGIDLLRALLARGQARVEVFILSKETNSVVKARARKLKLECVSSVSDKLSYLQTRFASARPEDKQPMSGLVYLGNDLNDLPVMRRCGFSVAPCDAHWRVREVASVVLGSRGGEGFVREFVERFFKLDDISMEEIEQLLGGA